MNVAGWTPQSFTSSRKNRAEVKQQSIYNFLDEDEKVVRFILSIMCPKTVLSLLLVELDASFAFMDPKVL